MPEAISIGPLLLPTRPLGIVALLLIAVFASGYVAQRAGLDRNWVRNVAERTAWVGLISARLGYVAFNWHAFADAPWTVLYFWQPGYSAYAGIGIGAAFVFWRINKRVLSERFRYLLTVGAGYASATVLIFSIALLLEVFSDADTLRKGDPVPDFTLQNLAGDKVSFSGLAGRAVILNFWATWCPPCRREMPLLDRVHEEYASRGVSIIGIDLGEPPEIVRAFVRRTGVSYPIWLDAAGASPAFDRTRDIYARFGGVGLPTTYFIDPTGVIRRVHVGELNRAILQDEAERLRPEL